MTGNYVGGENISEAGRVAYFQTVKVTATKVPSAGAVDIIRTFSLLTKPTNLPPMKLTKLASTRSLPSRQVASTSAAISHRPEAESNRDSDMDIQPTHLLKKNESHLTRIMALPLLKLTRFSLKSRNFERQCMA